MEKFRGWTDGISNFVSGFHDSALFRSGGVCLFDREFPGVSPYSVGALLDAGDRGQRRNSCGGGGDGGRAVASPAGK